MALVAGAYALARGFDAPPYAQASTETALLQQVAAKDSDNDGLPDWEEALYGTNPNNPDTFNLGMTDGEAVAKGLIVPKAIADTSAISAATSTGPDSVLAADGITQAPADDSLTSAFGQTFFTLYLQAKAANGGADLSSDKTAALAVQAMGQLGAVVPTADFKNPSDLTVSGSGADAMVAYAASAQAIIRKNAPPTTNTDLGYLQAALDGSDPTAVSSLTALAASYRDTAVGIAALPVPEELAADDLVIVNTMMRVSEIYSDFARINTDPLAAILALEQYPQAELDAEKAFAALPPAYAAAGASLSANTPGAGFVYLIYNLGAAQSGNATP